MEHQTVTGKAAVGKVAHYTSYGTPGGEYTRQCRAATITEVGGWRTVTEVSGWRKKDTYRRTLVQEWDPDMMGLVVHNPTGTFNNTTVPYHPGELGTEDPQMCDGLKHPGGTWHWPEGC